MVSMPTEQTDRRTDARPLHNAFRYECGQPNNVIRSKKCHSTVSGICFAPERLRRTKASWKLRGEFKLFSLVQISTRLAVTARLYRMVASSCCCCCCYSGVMRHVLVTIVVVSASVCLQGGQWAMLSHTALTRSRAA